MIVSEKKNVRWGVVLSYVSLFISLIGTLFVTNRILDLFGDYNYGLYSFSVSITAWLTVVSSALVSSYLRFTSVESVNNDGDVSRTNTIYLKILFLLGLATLAIGSLLLGFLFFGNIPFAHYSLSDSKVIYALFFFSIVNISITFPASVFLQFIVYKKSFIYEKLIHIFITISQFVAQFLIAYFTKNVILITIWSIIATVINLVCNVFFCRRKLDIRFKKTYLSENKSLITAIVAFSSILLLNVVVDQINSNVDKILLGFFSTPDNVSIYQMGMLFSTYLGTICVAVSSVFAPKIHELYAKGDFEHVNSLFLRVSRIQAIIVTLIAFGFVGCGYDFVIWWLGSDRINAYYCGAVLMVLNIMPLSVKLSIEIQRAANKHKFRSFLYLIVAIANIGLSILFLLVLQKEYAIFACLIGTIISSIVCQWIAMNVYNKVFMKLPMEKHWFQLGKQIVFGAIGAVISIASGRFIFAKISSVFLRFFLEGLIYVVFYMMCLLLFDRKFIFGFFHRNNTKDVTNDQGGLQQNEDCSIDSD